MSKEAKSNSGKICISSYLIPFYPEMHVTLHPDLLPNGAELPVVCINEASGKHCSRVCHQAVDLMCKSKKKEQDKTLQFHSLPLHWHETWKKTKPTNQTNYKTTCK